MLIIHLWDIDFYSLIIFVVCVHWFPLLPQLFYGLFPGPPGWAGVLSVLVVILLLLLKCLWDVHFYKYMSTRHNLRHGSLLTFWRFTNRIIIVDGGGHWLVRMMCLPLLIFPCTIKSRSFLVLAHPGGPGKRAVKRLWCVVVSVLIAFSAIVFHASTWAATYRCSAAVHVQLTVIHSTLLCCYSSSLLELTLSYVVLSFSTCCLYCTLNPAQSINQP